ncbi:hypothetical protein KDA_46890 [Dictyobacter alpinus]|uniref:Uncharacterized protein n=1 Tax=Dictyobacter alpinus TaxID=2014873 RepID=A0A402BCW6_9CHLR|nr:hypothetical protein KDA_46890 [Dictyobacter alpinus]
MMFLDNLEKLSIVPLISLKMAMQMDMGQGMDVIMERSPGNGPPLLILPGQYGGVFAIVKMAKGHAIFGLTFLTTMQARLMPVGMFGQLVKLCRLLTGKGGEDTISIKMT